MMKMYLENSTKPYQITELCERGDQRENIQRRSKLLWAPAKDVLRYLKNT